LSRVDDILAQVELTSVVPPDCNLRSIGPDRWRGNCPIQEHRSRGTFSVLRHDAGHKIWNCYACGLRGSVIDLVAALDGSTVGAAIKKLSSKDLEPLSRDAILTRAYDQIERQRPEFGILACDQPSCYTTRNVGSELDFAIFRAGSSWLWKVSPNGRHAICWKHPW